MSHSQQNSKAMASKSNYCKIPVGVLLHNENKLDEMESNVVYY